MNLKGTGQEVWSTPVLDAVWHATRKVRRSRHLAAGQGGCPGRGAPGVEGRKPSAECVRTGCADVFQELCLDVVDQLKVADQLSWNPAWLGTVARNQLADMQRRSRARAGMPARPTRSAGVSAAVEAAIEELSPGKRQQEWLVALFRMMRGHVYRTDRTCIGWPIEAWAGEKALYLGGIAISPAEVAGDIRWILDVAAQTAGAGWVHRSILAPLTSVRDEDADLGTALTQLSVEDYAIVVLVAATFQTSRRSGVPVREAWRKAMRLVGGAVDSRPQAWAVELLEAHEVA